jgi:hypothetical protein|tara:strand:+ start:96 stop:242 length:147 start_codon:yes stop_codon:yes gene_type:complete
MNRQKKIKKIYAKKKKKYMDKLATKTEPKYIAKADREVEAVASKTDQS